MSWDRWDPIEIQFDRDEAAARFARQRLVDMAIQNLRTLRFPIIPAVPDLPATGSKDNFVHGPDHPNPS